MKTSAVEKDVKSSSTTSSIILEEPQSKSHRASSLDINHTAHCIDGHHPLGVNFQARNSLGNLPLMEKWVQERDPLTVLYSVTDGVLFITAIIFIISLGFVAVIVVMAIVKVYFLKDEYESIWINDWFWPE